MSGIINKVKEVLHKDKDHDATTHSSHSGVPEGTAGPHSSRVANAADPRVDSDMDGSHRNTAGSGLTGTHNTHGTSGLTGTHNTHGTSGLTGTHGSSGLTGTHGSSGLTGTHTGAHTGTAGGYGTGPALHTAGPHKSDALNKADPRVDSDMDGSSGLTGAGAHNTHQGAYGTGSGLTGTHGSSGLTGTHGSSGLTGTHGSSGLTGTHNTHGTSGLTGSHNTSGFGSSNNPVTGHNDPTGTHGPHSSRVANAADPRVDSDRDHRGTHATSGLGSGPAPNTAGPHKSDALNKLDPRVDSDRDGSKTVGGNQTHRAPDSSMRDPTDAAQVPPSVLKQHIGEPIIAHDDHNHDYARRNSVPSHQEQHRGL